MRIEDERTDLRSGGDGWPAALLRIDDAPDRLHVLGSVKALHRPMVAIVGSRKATPYGIRWARALARAAAEKGIAVVTGGARGIDGAAMRAALAEGGTCVAVLGGGCGNPYPVENGPLFREIVSAGGAVVSEHSWEEPPLPYRLRARNRITAAFAEIMLVVEAGMPSSIFVMADEAMAAGRDVMAVPGRIDDPCSIGCNILISQGARMVRGEEDWDSALSFLASRCGA